MRPTLQLLASTLLVPLSLVGCATQETGPATPGAVLLVSPGDDLLALPPGAYHLPPVGPEGRSGVLRLEGLRDEVVDLSGLDLRGAPEGTDPDERAGWGVVLVDCIGVTLRGARLGGYKACVVLEGCEDVTLEDLEFDGWFARRLRSSVAAEDAADRLHPHANDEDEWLLDHGAAISATDCRNLTIRRCTGRRGQNGVLLTRVEGSQVYDNDFSFLSGWGLAMYRASGNTVSHNWFDYCVRGYSHGVYAQGQSSAGILMFERCSDNVVAFNSATHGGSGVLVFAGRDLVEGRARERGEGDPGGCDRNLFYGNDLRWSAANALEVTFSDRNRVVANDLSGGAQHGVWGGYSRSTLIFGNTIDDTVGAGVSIEHGQDNVIAQNALRRNARGVELCWDAGSERLDGPFGEQRDTSSRDTWVLGNRFENNTQDLVVKRTTGLVLFDNTWGQDEPRMPYLDQLGAEVEEAEEVDEETLRTWLGDRTGALPTGHLSRSTLRPWGGRSPDLMDELDPLEAPEVPGTLPVRAEERGLQVGDRSTIVLGEWGPWDHRSGEARPAQVQPGGLLARAAWDAAWFRWDEEASDPRRDLEVWRALAAKPLVRRVVPNLGRPWPDDDLRAVVGDDHFGLVARTSVEVAGGTYDLVVTSDDGVRVLVDGEQVLADWTWHAQQRDQVRLELAPGLREVTVEYFQIDGAAALRVELHPVE